MSEKVPKLLEHDLGNVIRGLRIRHGLTIAAVADRAGISRGMLSSIENAPGDSFTFRGEIPHRPERVHTMPIRFLSIIHDDHPAEIPE